MRDQRARFGMMAVLTTRHPRRLIFVFVFVFVFDFVFDFVFVFVFDFANANLGASDAIPIYLSGE
jgi:hypothetical protein